MVVNLTLASVADWIAWAALIISISVIAWTAFHYIQIEKVKNQQRRFDNFYRTLERVHNKDQSLILQRAAIFELRNFHEYKDFIVRLCRDRNSLFPEVERVQQEFLLTLRYFEGDNR